MDQTNVNETFKDFPYICRVCLSNRNLKPFHESYELLKLFEDITHIQVEFEVDLPKNVCSECIDQLQNISSFISLSKNNDINLKQYVDERKPEVFHDDASLDYDANDTQHFSDHSDSDEFDSDVKVKSEDSTKSIKSETDDSSQERKKHKGSKRHSTKPQSCNCDTCGEHFASKSKLTEHQKKSANCKSKKFPCKNCEKSFFSNFKLKIHMRSHTKETPFECNICFKKFRHSSNLKRHDDTVHKGIKPFKCEVCGKEFSRLVTKNDHMYTHTGEYPYVCVHCGKTFRAYSHHFMHVCNQKLNNGEPVPDDKKNVAPLVCKICDKGFDSKSGFMQHLEVHGEKKFLCVTCGKLFTRKGALEIHVRLHTGEKPHICKYCGKGFRLTGGYKNHMLIHTGEKPYQCKLCKKSFRQSTHLSTHMKIHTGQKTFQCSFCGKGFVQKCNLKAHTRIHTGETPYHCSVCGTGFCDSSNLRKHEKEHLMLK